MQDQPVEVRSYKVTRWDIAGLLAAFAAVGALLFMHRWFFHDDAFISLRYARNLVEHGELAWNLGERLEGYTNFLHILLTSGLMEMGIPAVTAARLLNALAAACLILSTWSAARIIAPARSEAPLRAFTIFAVAASPAIAIWILGGLEAVVVAAFVALGLLAVLNSEIRGNPWRGRSLAALWFSLAVLTRLDSAVFVAGAGLGLLLVPGTPFARRFLAACIVTGIPALVSFVHMGWRFWFYGEFFPLTFYAKVGVPLSIRTEFLPEFLSAASLALPIVFIGAVVSVLALLARRTDQAFWLIATPVVLQLAYVFWSGGDHMPAGRVLVPLVAPTALLVLAVVRQLDGKLSVGFAGFAAALSLVAAILHPPLRMDGAAFVGRLVGLHIKGSWPRDALVALNTAGSTPYFADQMRYIDMLGLNDPHIAKRKDFPILTASQKFPGHAKGDGQYVVDRAPDYIIIGPAEGVPASQAWLLSGKEMDQIAEFHDCYDLRSDRIEIPPEERQRDPAGPNRSELTFTYYVRTCD